MNSCPASAPPVTLSDWVLGWGKKTVAEIQDTLAAASTAERRMRLVVMDASGELHPVDKNRVKNALPVTQGPGCVVVPYVHLPGGFHAIPVAEGPGCVVLDVVAAYAEHGTGELHDRYFVPGVRLCDHPVARRLLLENWLGLCATGNGRPYYFGVKFKRLKAGGKV